MVSVVRIRNHKGVTEENLGRSSDKKKANFDMNDFRTMIQLKLIYYLDYFLPFRGSFALIRICADSQNILPRR